MVLLSLNISSLECYDVSRNEWTNAAQMSVPRGGVAVASYSMCFEVISEVK